ncbi:hypothetical protein FE840_000150 [Peteryoungia desertarenae]|uniref:Uncharacterized protein n=1 Tax=Peteryoungia desertarenae TaxID=1813451 RepID=A0ABX6QHQ7_9HYPH|nr:hypothetical protein [Peteryoungia desertarenae]QLF68098.1 hypothetical protein FE840_000150 [Peteryoungia desertarenae]
MVENELVSDIDSQKFIDPVEQTVAQKTGAIIVELFCTLEELEHRIRLLLGSIKVANWSMVPDRIALSREQYEASIRARSASRLAAGEDAGAVERETEAVLTDGCYQRYLAQTEGSNVYKAIRVEAARRELDEGIQRFNNLTGQSLEINRNGRGELSLSAFRLLYSDGSPMLVYPEDGSLAIYRQNGALHCRYAGHKAPLVELIGKRQTSHSS